MNDELGIPHEFEWEMALLAPEIHEKTGSSDQGCYGYFFYVPEEASKELLAAMNWSKNQCIYLSVNTYD